MKRYLISGVLTLIVGLLIVGCHEKTELEHTNPVQTKTEEFDKAFKAAFTSKIDPNQDWGFGLTSQKAATRGATDDNADDDDPDNVNNPGNQTNLVEETKEMHQTIIRKEYFKKRRLLQYGRVFCEDLGSNYASNRKDFDYNDVVFDAYLHRDEWWKKTTKVNVYEVRKYEKQELERYVTDDAGQNVPIYKQENGQAVIENGQPVIIGYQTETYNALVYKESEVHNELDGEPTWERVKDASEISSNNLDKDGRGRRYYADILLLACGATKPIKVGGSDAPEVHYAFGGYAVDCVINAFDEHSTREGGFGYHEIVDPKKLDEMEIPIEYITVGKATIKDIPIFIQGGTVEARTLEADQGGVPQKFMSKNQDKWVSERCFLGDAYPNFTNWAENKDAVFSDQAGEDHLYCASYPSHIDEVLPFDVPTGAESTVCKDIEQKVDEATPNASLVRQEVIGGGDFDALVAEGYEVIEDATTIVTPTTPTTPTTPDTPTGGGDHKSGTNIVLVQNPNGQTTIGKDKFSNTIVGDEIRIYYSSLGQWYWQVQTWNGAEGAQDYTIPNWGGATINTKNSCLNTTDKYVLIEIDSSFLSVLKNKGIKIQCDSMTPTSIVLHYN